MARPRSIGIAAAAGAVVSASMLWYFRAAFGTQPSPDVVSLPHALFLVGFPWSIGVWALAMIVLLVGSALASVPLFGDSTERVAEGVYDAAFLLMPVVAAAMWAWLGGRMFHVARKRLSRPSA